MNEIIIRALEHERDNLLKEAGAVREKCAAIGDQITMLHAERQELMAQEHQLGKAVREINEMLQGGPEITPMRSSGESQESFEPEAYPTVVTVRGALLEKYRKLAGLTRWNAAMVAEMEEHEMRKLELEGGQMDVDVARKLAGVYHVKLESLIAPPPKESKYPVLEVE